VYRLEVGPFDESSADLQWEDVFVAICRHVTLANVLAGIGDLATKVLKHRFEPLLARQLALLFLGHISYNCELLITG